MKALTTAATGLEAQQARMADISNDIANVGTDGYKRSRTEFQDLMYQTVRQPASAGGSGQSPVGVQSGMGVKVGAGYKIFEEGPAKMTNHPYDFMIEGPRGFFPVQMPNGEVNYTRTGSFKKDYQGRLVLTNGGRFIPEVVVPNNAINVTVSNSGEMKAILPNQGEAVLGQIQLVDFPNQQGLLAKGEGLYQATVASGAPIQGIPGENGMGFIQQGALEGSNVNIANSMVDMISTQRGYEMGTKVMSVADQMMAATAAIKN